MAAVQSDWGDPDFAGDYPALSTGTAPSAPGKRAKRTFNKQQHALQQLVAETVVLQPRAGAGGQSNKQPHRSHSPAAGSKPAESVAEETEKPVSTNKKRKRTTSNAAVPADQQAPAAATGAADTGHAGAAEVSSNGTAAPAAETEPVKPKRQRNKFKAHLAQGAVMPAVAGPNAAHVAAQGDANRLAQPQTEAVPAADTHKRRNGKQRSRQTDAEAGMTAADGVNAPADAEQMHDEVVLESNMRSNIAAAAHEDNASASVANGSAKTERKRKKADKQGRTVHAESSAAAERTSQEDGSRPEATSGGAAAADGAAAQIGASPPEVPGKKKRKRKLAAADAAMPASQSREVAARRAEGSGRSQEPAARHTDGAKPAGKAQPVLDKMRERLQGGRFRWLNEQMYSVPGEESFQLMQEDPDLYQQYHEGFRQQTAGWPRQPVDVAIDWLRGKPAGWRVADFGCGDARLARTVQQEVHSFDLVATAPGVVACNMAAVPLEDASIDAAIFCLALMGTDYGSFLQEAQRALRKGGWLWIAEVRSRFAGMVGEESAADGDGHRQQPGGQAQPKVDKTSWVNLAFQQAMRQLGFKLVSRDAGNKMFVIMQFRKSGQTPAESIQWPQLKACVYKRR